jgi:hypothetical protein
MKTGHLVLLGGAALLLIGITKAQAGGVAQPSPALGAAVLQAATGNPNIVAKPLTVVPVGMNVAITDVPGNLSIVTGDVRIEGLTAPIANIPAGQLISNSELSYIAEKAIDESQRIQDIAATQAVQAQEAAYYVSNFTSPSPQIATGGGSGPWNAAWSAAGGISNLLNEALYQTIKAQFSGTVSIGSVLDFAKSINGHYAFYSWFQAHAIPAGTVNGKTMYRWA